MQHYCPIKPLISNQTLIPIKIQIRFVKLLFEQTRQSATQSFQRGKSMRLQKARIKFQLDLFLIRQYSNNRVGISYTNRDPQYST